MFSKILIILTKNLCLDMVDARTFWIEVGQDEVLKEGLFYSNQT